MTPLDRKLLVSSLVPDGQMSLPAAAYSDDSVLEWEMEHFFEESWVCVGRSEDLREPGERRAVSLGHERALLVRDEDGTLRAFYNVCRHRGHELLENGCTAGGKFIRCPSTRGLTGSMGACRGRPGLVEVSGSTRPITRSYPYVSPSGTVGSSSTQAGMPCLSGSTSATSGKWSTTTLPVS